jgi:hypothetical protein
MITTNKTTGTIPAARVSGSVRPLNTEVFMSERIAMPTVEPRAITRGGGPVPRGQSHDIARVEWLASLIIERLSPGTPAFDAAKQVMLEWNTPAGEWVDPPDDVVQAMLAAFWSLPANKRLAVLNGWLPLQAYPTLAEVRDHYDDRATVYRYAALFFSVDGIVVDHEFDAEQGYPSPVRIRIGEGANREEVLAVLSAAVEKVRTDWPSIITYRAGEQKGGSPNPTSPPPMPASERGEKARELTAA